MSKPPLADASTRLLASVTRLTASATRAKIQKMVYAIENWCQNHGFDDYDIDPYDADEESMTIVGPDGGDDPLWRVTVQQNPNTGRIECTFDDGSIDDTTDDLDVIFRWIADAERSA